MYIASLPEPAELRMLAEILLNPEVSEYTGWAVFPKVVILLRYINEKKSLLR